MPSALRGWAWAEVGSWKSSTVVSRPLRLTTDWTMLFSFFWTMLTYTVYVNPGSIDLYFFNVLWGRGWTIDAVLIGNDGTSGTNNCPFWMRPADPENTAGTLCPYQPTSLI